MYRHVAGGGGGGGGGGEEEEGTNELPFFTDK